MPQLLDRIFGRAPRRRLRPSGGAGGQMQPAYSSILNFANNYLQMEQDRVSKIRDYREMGSYPDVVTFLRAVSVEATLPDRLHDHHPMWIQSKSELVRKQWEIFHNRLNLFEKITAIARELAQFGETFFFNSVRSSEKPNTDPEEDFGISFLLYDEPENVQPVTDEFRQIIGYRSLDIVPQNGTGVMKKWEFSHYKLGTGSLLIENGESLLAGARQIWRMLKMMEDAVIIYRLVKGPDRFVYYIDIGNQQGSEALDTVRLWREELRRKSFLNQQTGEFDVRWLGLSVEEDLFWPIREGSNSKVEKLEGAQNLPHLEDVEYFRRKLYDALGMPALFFAQDGGGEIRARSLAMQDVWFARTVRHVQRALIMGTRRMFDIHLAAQQMDPRKAEYAYGMGMHNPSNIEEMQELESLVTKLDVADRLFALGDRVGADPIEWTETVCKDVINLPDKLVEALMDQAGTNPPQAEVPFLQMDMDQEQKDKEFKLKQQQIAAKPPPGGAKPGGQRPQPKKAKPKKEGLEELFEDLASGVLYESSLRNSDIPEKDYRSHVKQTEAPLEPSYIAKRKEIHMALVKKLGPMNESEVPKEWVELFESKV